MDIIGNFLHKKQIWREQIQHKTDTAVSDKPSPIWSFAGSFFRCFSVKSTHPNHPTIMYPPNLPIIDPTNFGDAFHRHKPEQQGIIQIWAQRWPPLEANHKLLQNVHRRQFFFCRWWFCSDVFWKVQKKKGICISTANRWRKAVQRAVLVTLDLRQSKGRLRTMPYNSSFPKIRWHFTLENTTLEDYELWYSTRNETIRWQCKRSLSHEYVGKFVST